MASKTKYLSLVFIFLIFAGLKLWAQSPKFVQKVEWSRSNNAAQYKVEIRSRTSGADSTFFTTTNTYVEFSMPAGSYEYRVYVYDFLGRVSHVSAWQEFEILKVVKPEVKSVENKIIPKSEEDSLKISVDVESVTPDSEVALINKETGEEIAGQLEFSEEASNHYIEASSAVFPMVEDGKWILKVTNPGGLFTESEELQIGEVLAEAPEDQTPAVEEEVAVVEEVPEELVATVEEEVAVVEEAPEDRTAEIEEEVAVVPVEAPQEEPVEIAKAEPINIEETEQIVEEVEEEAAEEPAPPKEKKPYKVAGIALAIGGGYDVIPTIGTDGFMNYTDYPTPTVNAALSYVPAAQSKKIRFGLELSGAATSFNINNDALLIAMPYLDADLNILVQYALVKDKLYLSAKLGGGVSFLFKYYEKKTDDGIVKGFGTYGYPNAMAGTSIVYTPFKFMQLEAGLNANWDFVTNMNTLVINPYVIIGVRF